MTADLHSSISKEPEMGGGEKRSPWLPDGKKKKCTLPASGLKSPCPLYDGPVDVLGFSV